MNTAILFVQTLITHQDYSVTLVEQMRDDAIQQCSTETLEKGMLGHDSMETVYTKQHCIPTLDSNGWKKTTPNSLAIDWDSEENRARVREMVALIKKGCGCKTGCQTSRCKCRRGGNYCFGCKCVRCSNLPTLPNTGTDYNTDD